MHKVEQVHSALNDAVGDGRYIPLPEIDFLDEPDKLLTYNAEQLREMELKKKKEITYTCANMVSSRYEGCRSLGTTISADVPMDSNVRHNFFFDEIYIRNWHDEKNKEKKESCPGSGYYTYLMHEIDNIYIRYDNGIEGFRQEGDFVCQSIERVPPPVPSPSNTSESFQYCTLESLPRNHKNKNANEFCPRTIIKNFVESCGKPEIITKFTKNVCEVVDRNNTLKKIQDGLPKIVEEYIGNDLKSIAKKHAEKIYVRKIQKISKKNYSARVLLSSLEYQIVQKSKTKLTIKKITCLYHYHGVGSMVILL
jgi:hypothetical protein